MTATQPEGLDMTDEQILAHFEMPGLNLEATLDAHDLGLLLTGIRALLSASKPAAPDIKVKNPKFKDGFQRFDWLCSLLPEGTNWGDVLDPNVLDDILLAAASPAAPAQSGEPVAIWRMVRANLNLIANSFANCKGSAAMMQDLAKDCLTKVDAYLDAAPQPSPTAVVLDERAAFEAWWVRDIPAEYREMSIGMIRKDMDREGISYLKGAWHGWQARAASPHPVAQPVEQIEFPYQRTFNAIAAATSMSTSNAISISVRAFQEAYNAGAQPVEQTRALTGWQPIETAPEGKLLVVMWTDKEEPENSFRCDFDYIEDGTWVKHADEYDHFCCVAPPESRGPSEKAPYTHWMTLPAAPTAARPASGETE